MSFEDFKANLGPKLSKNLQTASSIETVYFPTGSLQLNHQLGGGIGGGRITLIYGNFSAGKTMLVLQTIAALQAIGKVCGFIDIEKSLSREYAEALGVNVDELVVSQVVLASQVEDTIKEWIKAGIDFVAVDSISVMMPDAFTDKKSGELNGYQDRGQIGANSVAIKRLIKGIQFSMTDKNCAVVLISQTTTEIGQTYVKQIAEGGKAPGFYSSVIIKLTSSDNDAKQIKGLVPMGSVMVEEPIGRHVEATITKNKLNGRQSRKCEYDIYYGGPKIGIDNDAELIDLAVDYEIIDKGGAWFNYGDLKIQGREKLITHLREDRELFKEIKDKLEKEMYG
ncbi:RecA-like DNA recombinase [Rhodococcus phage NiceHouse]|nr:RecA-like DNA recombinase [Rhodococcus phage NiceHouse]